MPLESGRYAWDKTPETKLEKAPGIPENFRPSHDITQQEEGSEGLIPYILRNIVGKAPRYLYEGLRTAGGLTEPLRATTGLAGMFMNEEPHNAFGRPLGPIARQELENQESFGKMLFPSGKEVGKESEAIFPGFMQTRPGDEYGEFAGNLATLGGATGSFKSLPKAWNFAKTIAGAEGGSRGLGALTGWAGEQSGSPEVERWARTMGETVGGFGGAAIAHHAPGKVLEHLEERKERKLYDIEKAAKLKHLNEQLYEQEQNFNKTQQDKISALIKQKANAHAEFEQDKLSRINELQDQRNSELLEHDAQKQTQLDQLESEHNQQLESLNEELARLEVEKVQKTEQFRKERQEKIRALEEAPILYKKEMTYQQKLAGLYADEHERLGKNTSGDANNLRTQLNDIENNRLKGVPKSEKMLIKDFLDDLHSSIDQGKLSLDDAKHMYKRLNEMIRDTKSGGTMYNALMEFKNPLQQFISEVGSPEHNAAYKQYLEHYTNEAKTGYIDLDRAQEGWEQQRKFDLSQEKANKQSEIEQYKHDVQIEKAQEAVKRQEEAYKEKKKEIEGRKFEDNYKEDINNIKKEKFDPHHIYNNKISSAQRKTFKSNLTTMIDTLGKETWEDFKHNKNKQQESAKTMNKASTVSTLTDWGAAVITGLMGYQSYGVTGALAGVGQKVATSLLKRLGKNGFKTLETIERVCYNHPELLKEAGSIILDSASKSPVVIANRANALGKQIEDYSDELGKEYEDDGSSGLESGEYAF